MGKTDLRRKGADDRFFVENFIRQAGFRLPVWVFDIEKIKEETNE